jgi:acetyl esterase/lipase
MTEDRIRTMRAARCLLIGCLGITLAGCDTLFATVTPMPTATPTLVIIPASPTTNPVAPTAANDDSALATQVAAFTPAAPPVVGEQRSTVTPTPAPTQSSIPMQFVMSDGLTIIGTYWGAASRPAPAVLLLHMLGGRKEDWQPFAIRLRGAGYNVLAIDLRGYGETGGQPDWAKAQDDVKSIFVRLSKLPGVETYRVSIVGASIGANLALVACADLPDCRSVVLLSPALDYQGVKTADAMTRYGNRPALIAASRDDAPSGSDSAALDKLARGQHRLLIYEGSVHGLTLITAQPNLGEIMIRWLGDTFA